MMKRCQTFGFFSHLPDVCFKNVTSLPETTTVSVPIANTTTMSTTAIKLSSRAVTLTTTSRLVTTASSVTRPTTVIVTTRPSTIPSTIPSTTLKSTQKEAAKLTTTYNQSDVIESQSTVGFKDEGDMVIIEDEHDVEPDDDTPIPTSSTNESENAVNEKLMMKNTQDSKGIDVALIIKASVIAISTICVSLFIFHIVYKQYKASTNPLNYKEKHESGSRKANEEFSEIRYLTSDETLDFNLATAEMTEM